MIAYLSHNCHRSPKIHPRRISYLILKEGIHFYITIKLANYYIFINKLVRTFLEYADFLWPSNYCNYMELPVTFHTHVVLS